MTGFRFDDLPHTAATLAVVCGTSLKALMARNRPGVGGRSAALPGRERGQDADMVRYLARFGEELPVPS